VTWRSAGEVLRQVAPKLGLRRQCVSCKSTATRAFWDTEKRERVIGRCLECGANFHGPDVFLPPDWAQSSARGIFLEVDPHAACEHGHQPHAQERLPL
jgi:hypothetical protein